jgi:hypothetical protein
MGPVHRAIPHKLAVTPWARCFGFVLAMPRTIGLRKSSDATRVPVKGFAHIGERPTSHDRGVVVATLSSRRTMSLRVMLSIGVLPSSGEANCSNARSRSSAVRSLPLYVGLPFCRVSRRLLSHSSQIASNVSVAATCCLSRSFNGSSPRSMRRRSALPVSLKTHA